MHVSNSSIYIYIADAVFFSLESELLRYAYAELEESRGAIQVWC